MNGQRVLFLTGVELVIGEDYELEVTLAEIDPQIW